MTVHDADMHRFGQWWRRGVRAGFGYAQVGSVTKGGGVSMFSKQLRRSVAWGVGLPVMTVMAGLVAWPLALLAPTVLILQIVRIAVLRGGRADDWRYGWLITAVKFAEAQGVIRYCSTAWRRGGNTLIEYK